jgi:nitrite reductase/ring-hydroxylating ferredoxin subunit
LRSIVGLVGSFGRLASGQPGDNFGRRGRAALFLYTERCSAIEKHATQRPETRQLMRLPIQRVESGMAEKVELCASGEVAEGAALKVETHGLTLAVFNVDGEFYVMDDNCTHGPGSLSEGYIEGDVVECNFHNGQFNIRTGEVVSPPCMIPMKTYPASVDNGKVVIEI